MKNKVLRLAIVAVLVVAMVLSMAACNDPKPVDPTPVVTPTPTKTPDKTVAPSTPAPTKTPDVSTDEATLEAKYGITFPVAEDMKVSFVGEEKALTVLNADKTPLKFGAKAPAYNDAFNAYKGFITVSAKVNGLTAEGNKVTINDLKDENGTELKDPEWAYYFPTAAGTYTVVYTVKVAYASPEAKDAFGFYIPAKVSETYSVTKVYEVAKKAITIESVSDAFAKSSKLEYPAAVRKIGSELSAVQENAVLEELKLYGTEKKFDLSIDIVSADLTAYGTYPLTLVCLDGKKQKVDLATLVAPDFEVTFKNGNRYVLTDAELAASAAATDDVTAAKEETANKEVIELGVATFSALSDAAKTHFLKTNLVNVGAMNMNYKNLSRNGMVEEAFKLAKTWNDKLQNVEDGKAFVTYMLSLGKDPVYIDGVPYGTDYDFVVKQLKAAVTADATGKAYITTALALVKGYEDTALDNFTKQFQDGFMEALKGIMGSEYKGTGIFNNKEIENLAKEVAKLQAKYDALVKGQSDTTVLQVNTDTEGTVGEKVANITVVDTPALVLGTDTMENLMVRASKASEELTARYAAYATLVDGLDAYTGDKVTGADVTLILGYNFKESDTDPAITTAKKVNFKDAEDKAAAHVLFATIAELSSENGYVVFKTPMLFVENTTKSFKTLVDAYVALDAAIVSAQKDVITNLGSKIALAVDGNIRVTSFDPTANFAHSGTPTKDKDLTRLEALQKYIATTALAAVKDPATEPPFAALAKKELSVVIAAALKDPVAAVNDYIKDENAFGLGKGTASTTAITLDQFFAIAGDMTAANVYEKNLTIKYYNKTSEGVYADAVLATAASVTKNTITPTTWTSSVTVKAGDKIEVIYNGVSSGLITVA